LSHSTSLFESELSTTFAQRTQRKLDAAWWLSLDQDIRLIRGTRASVMLVGTADVVDALLRRVTASMQAPQVVQCQDPQLCLPAPSSGPRGVLFRDIEVLGAPEQRRLLHWLESDRPGPVFSTARIPLFPLVQSGFFNETLLYRLNTVYIDVSDIDPVPFLM
jgi:hypothetical protein